MHESVGTTRQQASGFSLTASRYRRFVAGLSPWPLFLVGVAMESIWLLTRTLGPLREHTGAFVCLMLAAFVLCLASYLGLPIWNHKSVLLVIIFGLLFRLTGLFSPPYQSEDVYRYLWDAKMAAMGIGPYQYPPNAPQLTEVRDQLYPMVNSKPYITAYPPLSQVLFRACYTLFGARVTPMKALFMLLEFSSVLLAWRLLTMLGRPLDSLYLVAWNPFFIFEFSHSGHSDSAMLLFIYLSIYLLYQKRASWAMVSYAGAVASKLHPALLFPLLLRRTGWKASLVGLAAGATLFVLFFNLSTALLYFGDLRLYFRLFEFNASIHYLLRYVGLTAFNQSWDKLTGPYLVAVLLAIAIPVGWRFPLRNNLDIMHAGFWIMTADLCLATTVHPWYISWAALALPFFPYAFMIYWTGACFLSYVAYAYHPVSEPRWVLLVEYLPMYGLMAWELIRGGPLWQPQKGEI